MVAICAPEKQGRRCSLEKVNGVAFGPPVFWCRGKVVVAPQSAGRPPWWAAPFGAQSQVLSAACRTSEPVGAANELAAERAKVASGSGLASLGGRQFHYLHDIEKPKSLKWKRRSASERRIRRINRIRGVNFAGESVELPHASSRCHLRSPLLSRPTLFGWRRDCVGVGVCVCVCVCVGVSVG